MLQRLFQDHPASVGESYGEHMQTAFSFGGRMILCGVACLIHGLLPFLFKRTGSNAIRALHDDMITHRVRRRSEPAQQAVN